MANMLICRHFANLATDRSGDRIRQISRYTLFQEDHGGPVRLSWPGVALFCHPVVLYAVLNELKRFIAVFFASLCLIKHSQL